MNRTALFIVLALAIAVPAFADHHYVDLSGMGDHTNIKEAVLWAGEGDTVFVMPGTYSGESNRNMSFGYKNFTLISTDGPDVTIIDCEGADEAFTINGGQTSDAILSGFTIRNGTGPVGGGLVMSGASPTIENCRFVECASTAYTWGGGGVACLSSSNPTFRDVEFSGCTGYYGGALLSNGGSMPTLENVRFMNNVAVERGGGAYLELPSAPFDITGCVFFGNEVTEGTGLGGGLCLYGASPDISGTTFAMNAAVTGGCIALLTTSSPNIENSILALSEVGDALHAFGSNPAPVTTQCCVFGNAGGDTLPGTHSDCSFDDPLFCDVFTADLHLCANSPCAPGVNPWSVIVGAYDVGCADCGSPVEERSWGAIKALYR